MVRFGPKLEKRQAVLGRIVDIGSDLLVMTAVIIRARELGETTEKEGADALADLFCCMARRRITARFPALFNNDDSTTYGVARRFLDDDFLWLEEGIVSAEAYRHQAEAAILAGSTLEAEPLEPVPTT
jgi:hypothetical protein